MKKNALKKDVSVKKSKAAHNHPGTSPASPAPQVTKSRWQLVLSAVLCLLWMSVLAWLAAGH